MVFDSSRFNTGNSSYYYSGTQVYNGHAVALIGWDDTWSRLNFTNPPPGDGAFIARNSWGPGWGEKGYFHISYYDSKAGNVENAVFFAEPVSNYQGIYQFDPLGWISSLGFGTETAWMANVFTATATGEIGAFGIYAPVVNTGYQVRMYLNPSPGPVNSGGYALSQSGTIPVPGYSTIPLSPPVRVQRGDRFSLVLRLDTPGTTFPIPFEYPVSSLTSAASASPGESYVSSSGSLWSDLTGYSGFEEANVCLKAFSLGNSIEVTATGNITGWKLLPDSMANVNSTAVDLTVSSTAPSWAVTVSDLSSNPHRGHMSEWVSGAWIPGGKYLTQELKVRAKAEDSYIGVNSGAVIIDHSDGTGTYDLWFNQTTLPADAPYSSGMYRAEVSFTGSVL